MFGRFLCAAVLYLRVSTLDQTMADVVMAWSVNRLRRLADHLNYAYKSASGRPPKRQCCLQEKELAGPRGTAALAAYGECVSKSGGND